MRSPGQNPTKKPRAQIYCSSDLDGELTVEGPIENHNDVEGLEDKVEEEDEDRVCCQHDVTALNRVARLGMILLDEVFNLVSYVARSSVIARLIDSAIL